MQTIVARAPSHRGLAAALLLPLWPALLSAQNEVIVTAAPGQVAVAPGVNRSGWFYDGQLPGPLVRVTEGRTLRVRLVNHLPEPTTIHFHGQPMPVRMDGVPDMTMPAVPPGQEFSYEFTARPAGTYFFHPHVGLQLDRGLYGVLIVDPAAPGDPPFDREAVLVLDDLLAGAPVPGRDPVYADHLLNGRTSLGQSAIAVQQGEKLRLRVVNAASFTSYVLAIDGHRLTVTHADGPRVQPVTVDALPIGPGERYDVLVDAQSFGTWSIAVADLEDRRRTVVRGVLEYVGSTQPWPSPTHVPQALRNGTLLQLAQLASADPVPPISASPQRVYDLTLTGGMGPSYVWTIGGQPWPSAPPLPVRFGEAVRFRLRNMTMHWHPMHVHGHFWRVVGTAGGTARPPRKDTVLTAPGMMQAATELELLADNPGQWMFHCHNLYHAEAGMMRMLHYEGGDQDGDGLDDGTDLDPLADFPIATSDDLGSGYAIGQRFELRAQWPSGLATAAFAGPPLAAPLPLPFPDLLRIQPVLPLGSTSVGQDRLARFPIDVPATPALRGLRLGLQVAAAHATLPLGVRVSSATVVTLR